MNELPKMPNPPINDALAISILTDMIELGPNQAIAKTPYSRGEFFHYISKSPSLMNLYLANQELYAEIKAVEVIDIADSGEDAQTVKAKIMARTWFASRILHRKYGERLHVDHNVAVDIKGAIADARRRADIAVQYAAGEIAELPQREGVAIPEVVSIDYEGRRGNKGASVAIDGTFVSDAPAYKKPLVWAGELIDKLPEESKPEGFVKPSEEVDIFS